MFRYGLNKYKAKKIDTADGRFDSGLEYKRWLWLKDRERAGEITGLKRQVSYRLIPPQKDSAGNTLFRECRYVADFVYVENGHTVVEDTKSKVTAGLPEFKIKQKLMFRQYGILVRVVTKW